MQHFRNIKKVGKTKSTWNVLSRVFRRNKPKHLAEHQFSTKDRTHGSPALHWWDEVPFISKGLTSSFLLCISASEAPISLCQFNVYKKNLNWFMNTHVLIWYLHQSVSQVEGQAETMILLYILVGIFSHFFYFRKI